MSDKEMQENIDCYDCGAQFTIKYSIEQEKNGVPCSFFHLGQRFVHLKMQNRSWTGSSEPAQI